MDGKKGTKTASVTATDGHPFWVPALHAWIKATDLTSGEWLRTSAGTYVQITAIDRWTAQDATVHNLTVSDVHRYYVVAGATSLLVHNDSCPTDEAGLAAAERAGDHFDRPSGATGALHSAEGGWFPDPLSSGGRNIHPSVDGNPAPGTRSGYKHHLEAQAAAIMRDNPSIQNATLYIHFRDPEAVREVCWACGDSLADMLPSGTSLTVVFRLPGGRIFRSDPYIGNAC